MAELTAQPSRPVAATLKLIELTQDDKLRWRPLTAPALAAFRKSFGSGVESAYQADYDEYQLTLYRAVKSESADRAASSLFEGPSWGRARRGASTVHLVLFGNGGNWEFPSNNALDDLMRSVEHKMTGANDFIDKLLQE